MKIFSLLRRHHEQDYIKVFKPNYRIQYVERFFNHPTISDWTIK